MIRRIHLGHGCVAGVARGRVWCCERRLSPAHLLGQQRFARKKLPVTMVRWPSTPLIRFTKIIELRRRSVEMIRNEDIADMSHARDMCPQHRSCGDNGECVCGWVRAPLCTHV